MIYHLPFEGRCNEHLVPLISVDLQDSLRQQWPICFPKSKYRVSWKSYMQWKLLSMYPCMQQSLYAAIVAMIVESQLRHIWSFVLWLLHACCSFFCRGKTWEWPLISGIMTTFSLLSTIDGQTYNQPVQTCTFQTWQWFRSHCQFSEKILPTLVRW